jgi:hypothetical protein
MKQRVKTMNTTLQWSVMLLSAGLAVAGCVNDPQLPATSSVTKGASPYIRGDLGTLTYRAVDLILAAAPEVTADTRLIVASVSDTQNVEATTALGNIVSDMIRTRLAQDGRTASEIRLRNEVSFSHGEAISYDNVYMSIKLASATDARIIAGADFVVPLHDVEGLLHQHVL